MKKEDLLSKWLDHDLTADELKAFEQSDAFGSLSQLDRAAKAHRAASFDVANSYEKLLQKKQSQSAQKVSWKNIAFRVAAVAVIAIGLYVAFFNNPATSVMADRGDQVEMLLPDQSEVILNAGSEITYAAKAWNDNRSLNLKGEAYFKVAKGSKFTVYTEQGDVSVLGTQFNVKNRAGIFEVSCYEGLVEVVYNGTSYKLPAGNNFSVINGHITEEATAWGEPSWIQNKSIFKSTPLRVVLDEIERQYNIRIISTDVDKSVIFTGSFTHENLETALKAITIPFSMTYEVDENTVILKK